MRYAYPFVLMLAGCSTVWHSPTGAELEQLQEERRQESAEAGARKAAEIIKVYGPQCEAMGYVKNTDAWRQCVLARYDAQRQCLVLGNPQTCN